MAIKRVCIVGASGKLGRYLVRQALDRGWEIVAVCRERSAHKLAPFTGRITIVPGATCDSGLIARAVAGCDGVPAYLRQRRAMDRRAGKRSRGGRQRGAARVAPSCGRSRPGEQPDATRGLRALHGGGPRGRQPGQGGAGHLRLPGAVGTRGSGVALKGVGMTRCVVGVAAAGKAAAGKGTVDRATARKTTASRTAATRRRSAKSPGGDHERSGSGCVTSH